MADSKYKTSGCSGALRLSISVGFIDLCFKCVATVTF